MQLTKFEWVKVGGMLAATAMFFWVVSIRPHSVQWVSSGEVQGEVRSLMSNSNVFGAAYVSAVVTLDDGAQTIVRVPIRSDVRAGDRVKLELQTAEQNAKKRQYKFISQLE